jgi:hypothetical protein
MKFLFTGGGSNFGQYRDKTNTENIMMEKIKTLIMESRIRAKYFFLFRGKVTGQVELSLARILDFMG